MCTTVVTQHCFVVRHTNYLHVALIVPLVLLYSAVSLHSQNESGIRPLDSASFSANGWLKVDSTVAFRRQFPILRSVPPLSPTLPWQINLDFVVMDSVLRTFDPTSLRDTIVSSSSNPDSLCLLFAELYRLLDYNPLLLAQYGLETQLQWDHDVLAIVNNDTVTIEVGRYRSTLNELLAILQTTFKSEAANYPTLAARYATTFAPIICRVKVLEVDSLQYTTTYRDGIPITLYYYQVTAQILDTLKGGDGIPAEDVPNEGIVSNPPLRILRFDYTTNTWNHNHINNGINGLTVDTAFVSNGHLALTQGDEAVVFLSYQSPRVDAQYDYFRLSVDRDYSMGLLRIDGQNRIVDDNNIWKDEALIDYQSWVTLYNNTVQSLLHCE